VTVIRTPRPWVGEALVHVQGESLKASANLLSDRFSKLPDHQNRRRKKMSPDGSKIDTTAIMETITKNAKDANASFLGFFLGPVMICSIIFGPAYWFSQRVQLDSLQQISLYIITATLCIIFTLVSIWCDSRVKQTIIISQLDALFNLLNKK